MSLTAGDIIICGCTLDPAARTVTFSKTAGTGAIGAFTNRTKITNGVQGLTVGYCSVTTTGTVTITATANSTPTSGALVIEVYSGASGIKGGTGGTGASGTDLTRSITTLYANSWVVLVGSCVVTTTTPTNGTGCTVERSIACNITGTANDVVIAIGSNEAALSPQTFASHMVKLTGVAYSADILELVQQWTYSATGGGGGASADKAMTNYKPNAAGTEAGASARVATTFLARSGTEAGASSRSVPTNKQPNAAGTEAGASSRSVTANLKAGAGIEASAAYQSVRTNVTVAMGFQSATASMIVRSGLPTATPSCDENGNATIQIMTNCYTARGRSSSTSVTEVSTNLTFADASESSFLTLIASSVRMGSGITTSSVTLVAKEPAPLAVVTFADDFNRADGLLGPPWEKAYATGYWANGARLLDGVLVGSLAGPSAMVLPQVLTGTYSIHFTLPRTLTGALPELSGVLLFDGVNGYTFSASAGPGYPSTAIYFNVFYIDETGIIGSGPTWLLSTSSGGESIELRVRQVGGKTYFDPAVDGVKLGEQSSVRFSMLNGSRQGVLFRDTVLHGDRIDDFAISQRRFFAGQAEIHADLGAVVSVRHASIMADPLQPIHSSKLEVIR